MQISPARIAAHDILLRIESYHAFSSVLLPQCESELSERDAALCHQIVLGVLRRKLYLDARIRNYAGNKKLDLEVLTALRIGAYQLLELDRIPNHSAVNESVALVQRAKKTSAKGLVNAVLRRISSEETEGESYSEEIVLSHPAWLLERWIGQFGHDRASKIAEANNEPARSAYRFTANSPDTASLEGEPSQIAEGAFTVSRITTRLRQLSESGAIYFQDEASQLIANLVSIPNGGRFLDVCAAPGGKTALVAAKHINSSPFIVAGDLHHQRVQFLRANCIIQGVSNICPVQYDAAGSLPFADGSFDSILLDAPCSGTGTIRSNPEIRYFLRPEDILDLSRKQLAILRNASKLLKPGGKLFYSTCSLEREENEDVIKQFLAEVVDFESKKPDVDARFITDNGFGRTFPDREGTDGFFFAVLARR